MLQEHTARLLARYWPVGSGMHQPGLLQGGVVSLCGSTDFGKMEMRGKFLFDGNLTVETNCQG